MTFIHLYIIFLDTFDIYDKVDMPASLPQSPFKSTVNTSPMQQSNVLEIENNSMEMQFTVSDFMYSIQDIGHNIMKSKYL